MLRPNINSFENWYLDGGIMFYLIRVKNEIDEWVFVTESYSPLEFVSKEDAENAAKLIGSAVFVKDKGLQTPEGEEFARDDDFFEFCEEWADPLETPFTVQVVTCTIE